MITFDLIVPRTRERMGWVVVDPETRRYLVRDHEGAAFGSWGDLDAMAYSVALLTMFWWIRTGEEVA